MVAKFGAVRLERTLSGATVTGRAFVLFLSAVAFLSASGVARAESPRPLEPLGRVAATDQPASPSPAGQTGESPAGLDQAEEEFEEYDPWEPFNEKAFKFNYNLDRYGLKPAAKGYDKVVPNFVERAIANIFENIGSFRRIINLSVQGRFNDSGQELGRFVINTMFGLGGLIDAAPSFGVGKVDADTGQTFGVFGAGPGPYLMLPLFEPLTVRDAVGQVFDSVMDPTSWLVPFEIGFSSAAVRRVNDRALSLELYENVEETVVDLYGAVRNGYLQRRRALIREGRAKSRWGHRKPTQSGSDGADPPDVGTRLPAPAAPPEQVTPGTAAASGDVGRLEADQESFLIVDVTPSEAEVVLDGQALGSAGELLARAVAVARGHHTVEIAAKGFRPSVARFVADPSFPARVRVALAPE